MSFDREESSKRKNVPESWRSPTGTHSKSRRNEKGAVPKPEPGYRTAKDRRNMHPSGLEEVQVHNPSDLEDVNEDEAARIGSTVGGRKKEKIVQKADEKDIHVLNRGEY